MKKFLFAVAIVLCGVSGANAQLSVLNNGRVQIGEETTTGTPGILPANTIGIVIPGFPTHRQAGLPGLAHTPRPRHQLG